MLLHVFTCKSALAIDTACPCQGIALVSSNSHFGLVHRIEALLSQQNKQLLISHIVVDALNQTNLGSYCLIVPIGSKALMEILIQLPPIPIFSVVTRKNIFHELLAKYGYSENDPKHPISAIYLDQPLARQLNLIQQIDPTQKNTIGILLGAQSLIEQETLQTLGKEKNLPLNIIHINPTENPVAVIDNLLNEDHILLVLPDNTVYTPKTTRGILLTAFHKRTALIGYSKTYVINGALAAVYSTMNQISEQTAEEITHIIENHYQKLPPPQYPKEFIIELNYQVAHSLGMDLPSETEIKHLMQEKELR